MTLWTTTTEGLLASMQQAGIFRAALVWDPERQQLEVSHPMFREIRDAVAADQRDFDQHEACFFEVGSESSHLMAAVLHRTVRGQGAGGVRFWTYDDVESFVRDGLRLSRGMGQKSALAGLWWGGGKGLIARRPDVDHRDPQLRAAIYRDYGRFMSGLRGCYVTAEDVGTTPPDMARIHTTTRYTTCIPESMGGSGNPSGLTAHGVVRAMEAALHDLDRGSLEGKTIAMQGLGNEARFMVEDLLSRGVARIVAVDIDEKAVEQARLQFADERLEAGTAAPGDTSILAEACDILAPNAVGEILNPQTIPTIKAAVVCGAANNQLQEVDRDSELLHQRGILYVPDFLANRMGIVNCANEQYGTFPGDPAIESHLDRTSPQGVFQRSLEVFQRARASGKTPAEEASALADELAAQPHPVWGHRSRHIIQHLWESGWAEQSPG